jgi:hypothetical protein
MDIATGEQLKREGMQLALDFAGDWADRVVMEFRAWAAVQKAMGFSWITVEQFRSQAKNLPESHKAWGSLPRLLCKADLIAPTGEYVRAASPKTHAHPVAKWTLL